MPRAGTSIAVDSLSLSVVCAARFASVLMCLAPAGQSSVMRCILVAAVPLAEQLRSS